MWTKFMKGSFVLGVFLIAIRSFAATELSLEDVRKEVLNKNLDIRVQYEKYYQAQKGVSVALGQFLPNANINLININATLAILQSVVPTPSNWFAYQASKELSIAERFTTESIKLNILEGLTINYMNLKHQEALMASLKEQETFLDSVHADLEEKEKLGLATANDVFLAKRNLLLHRQDIFALNSLMVAEKQAMMIALNRSPNEEVILGDLPVENLEAIPGTALEGEELAVKNSTELISNSFQAEAAKFMVASKKWSFISFNGIGFDYSSTLAIERSRARVIELQREQIELKIRNQVFAAYDELAILDQRVALQEGVVSSTREMDERNTELFENEMLPLNRYLESKKTLSSEERVLIKLRMERRVKIAQIKRLLGLDASLSKFDVSNVWLVKHESRGRRGTSFTMNVTGEGITDQDIVSVTYLVENVFDEYTTTGINGFSYSFRLSMRGKYRVIAKIRMVSGEVFERTEILTVE